MKKRFSLGEFHQRGIDIDEWPEPDFSALSERDRRISENRLLAFKDYVKRGRSVAEIEKDHKVSRSTLFRILPKSLIVVDGDYLGFMAVVPHRRTAKRKDLDMSGNVKPQSRNSDSGIFSRFLSRYPQLDDWLSAKAKIYKNRTEGGSGISALHLEFLQECERIGIVKDEYPFNKDERGRKSLEPHLDKRRKDFIDEQEALRNSRAEEENAIQATAPLDEVQADGHEVDLRLVIEEEDLYGEPVRYEILRVWLITIMDVFSRCILGYSIALGKNYDQMDVLQAIFNALTPHRRPPEVINGAQYYLGGGFPSEINEEFAWKTWLSMKLDNALAHKATHVKYILDKKIGCIIDYGPPHCPNDRAIIERFFRFIVDNFSHRVVGTTGSHSKDKVREALSPSKASGLSLLMSLDELKHAMDIVISDYNGKPHSGICGNTPLNLFCSYLERNNLVSGTLRQEERQAYEFFKKTEIKTVRGSKKESGAYVNFANLKYRNVDALRSSMIGRKVLIAYDVRDVSNICVFTLDGKVLGILKPGRPWCDQPHSLQLRQALFKAWREGHFKFKEGQSLLEACSQLKQQKGNSRSAVTESYKLVGQVLPARNSEAIGKKQSVKSLQDNIQPVKLTRVIRL